MGKRKIRAREGDTQKERERMPERCMKIVHKNLKIRLNKQKTSKNKTTSFRLQRHRALISYNKADNCFYGTPKLLEIKDIKTKTFL